MRAKGGADWNTYQTLKTPADQEDFLKSKNTDYKTAAERAQAWGIGGSNSRALNAVTIAITGALGGQTDLQVAANSLSPYAAQLIGEQWGHAEEKKFMNDDGEKIMFAGISENAFLLSGHSFVFLSDKEPELETQDIFNSLDISGESTSGNNWEKVIEVLHNDRCIPVQRWQGGNELSLRFFLYDDLCTSTSTNTKILA